MQELIITEKKVKGVKQIIVETPEEIKQKELKKEITIELVKLLSLILGGMILGSLLTIKFLM